MTTAVIDTNPVNPIDIAKDAVKKSKTLKDVVSEVKEKIDDYLHNEDKKEKVDVVDVYNFEQQVFNVEGFRIIIRLPSNTRVIEYPYLRAAKGTWTISKFISRRIRPCLPEGAEVIIVTGKGVTYPHGKMLLSTLRESYKNN